MRISLLLEREPFGEIVAATLARFWKEQHGRDYHVRWHEGRPGRDGAKGQVWLVNAYINAIFAPDVCPPVFEPIRREFSRSTVWWKRPLQRAYVSLATWPAAARRLAQASLQIEPAVPQAQQKLVVAGNHKIRLLDRGAGVAYGVLKDGFQPDFMAQEVAARRQARACGVAVPPLLAVAADESWFSERYVSGTPANRLRRPEEGKKAVRTVAGQLVTLYEETGEREALAAYAEKTYVQIREQVAKSGLLGDEERQAILRQAEALMGMIERAAEGKEITTVLTHGDFQPANVLANEDGVWLIDWEYAGRRQLGYDGLVYGLASRFPQGLAERLQIFVENGLRETAGLPSGIEGERQARYRQACLFLLEELALHLKENGQPLFTRPGQGLMQVHKEIARWVESELQDERL